MNIIRRLINITGVLLLILAVTSPIWMLLRLYYIDLWEYSAEFREYSDDFRTVRDFVTEYCEGSDTEMDFDVMYYADFGRMPNEINLIKNTETGEYVSLPNDVFVSLAHVIEKAFRDEGSRLDGILVDGKRVAFYCKEGRYALIYSPSGRPRYMLTPDESRIKTRNILFSGGWYHVKMN